MNDTTGVELGIRRTHEEQCPAPSIAGRVPCQLALDARPTPIIAANLQLYLSELHEHLARHFAHEENGGWLETAVIRLLRLGTQLTALEKQHAALLTRLTELIANTNTIAVEATARRNALRQFEGFAKQLLAHEACEERILRQGFNQDSDLCECSLASGRTKHLFAN